MNEWMNEWVNTFIDLTVRKDKVTICKITFGIFPLVTQASHGKKAWPPWLEWQDCMTIETTAQ